MVRLSYSTYRSFVIMVLTVLLVVPCFAKREIKQGLPVEAQRQARPEQPRVSCHVFCQLQEPDGKEKTEHHQQLSPVADRKPVYFVYKKIYLLPDFYNREKEKIPSYLLFERFLI